jgi:hypothetical protein
MYTDGKSVYDDHFPPRAEVVVDTITLLPSGSIDFDTIIAAQLAREMQEKEEAKKLKPSRASRTPVCPPSAEPPIDTLSDEHPEEAPEVEQKVKKRRIAQQKVFSCPNCGEHFTVSIK